MPASRVRATAPTMALLLLSVLLVAAWALIPTGRGIALQPDPDPARLKAAERLREEVAKRAKAGDLKGAITAQQKRIDLLDGQATFTPPARVEELRLLADLQTAADRFKDAVETEKRVEAVMKAHPKVFIAWRIRSATVGVAHAERLAALTVDKRKELQEAFDLVDRGQELESRKEDQERAKKMFVKARDVQLRLLGPDSPHAAKTMEHLGMAQLALNDFDGAEATFRHAERIDRKVLGADHPATAQVLGMIAMVLFTPDGGKQDLEQSIKLTDEAVRIFRACLGERDEHTVEHQRHLVARLLMAGRPEPALKRALEWLESIRKAAPDDPLAACEALLAVAMTYRDLNEYGKEEACYTEIRTAARIKKSAHWEAQALIQLGLLRQKLGSLEEAGQHFKKARDLLKEGDTPETLHDLAFSLTCLSQWYSEMDLLPDARKCLNEAIAIGEALQKQGQMDNADLGTLRARSGMLALRSKQFGSARDDLEKAIRYWQHVVRGVNRGILANLHVSLGQAYLGLKDFKRAQANIETAVQISLQAKGPGSREAVHALEALGDLHRQAGRGDEALRQYRRALNGYLELAPAMFPQLSELEAVRFASDGRMLRDRILTLAGPKRALTDAERYDLVWATQGLATQALAARAAGVAESAQARTLRDRLAQARTDLAHEIFAEVPEPDRAAQRLKMTALGLEKAKLERELAQESSRFARSWEVNKATPATLATLLPRDKDVAIVDIIRIDGPAEPEDGEKLEPEEMLRYELYILRRNKHAAGLSVTRVFVATARALEPILYRWHLAIQEKGKDFMGGGSNLVQALAKMTDKEALKNCGELVREVVWKKIEPHLGDCRTVVVVPDGVFQLVPWAAIPGGRPNTYLLHDYVIGTALNGRQLVQVLQPPPAVKPKPEGKKDLLLVGAVDYGKAKDARPPWPELKFSGPEVEAIAGLHGSAETQTVLPKREATAAAVFAALPRHRIAHLAIHAEFNYKRFPTAFQAKDPRGWGRLGLRDEFATIVDNSPLLVSGLVLAGANEQSGLTLGKSTVTAEQIAGLDLRGMDLAVLSACETAKGAMLIGEGSFSLQRAFSLAGTRSVVASLWQIDDPATRVLMEEFYRNLWEKKGKEGKPLGKLEALRLAQLALLHKVRDAKTGELRGKVEVVEALRKTPVKEPPRGDRLPPVFWAAFVLSGDWR